MVARWLGRRRSRFGWAVRRDPLAALGVPLSVGVSGEDGVEEGGGAGVGGV